MTRSKTTQADATKRKRTVQNGAAARAGDAKAGDANSKKPNRFATPLGRTLHELRARIAAEGAPPLNRDGVAREVAARRGESS